MSEEIDNLKNKLEELKEQEKNEEEKGQLKKQIQQFQFRKKHKKLLKVTNALEQGTKRFFKAIGVGIKGTAKALEKSDQYIAKQQYLEKQREKTNDKPKQQEEKKSTKSTTTEINDALNLVD
jgi:hypothetical protein